MSLTSMKANDPNLGRGFSFCFKSILYRMLQIDGGALCFVTRTKLEKETLEAR